jgi:hypothetical protein
MADCNGRAKRAPRPTSVEPAVPAATTDDATTGPRAPAPYRNSRPAHGGVPYLDGRSWPAVALPAVRAAAAARHPPWLTIGEHDRRH